MNNNDSTEEITSKIPAINDRFRGEGIDPNDFHNREYVLLHEDGQPPQEKTSLRGRYVSGFVQVNRPPKDVARCITDFDRHGEFIELFRNVSRLSENDGDYRVRYEAEVEMALLTLNVDFELKYRCLNDREWIWSCESGDIETYQGRIELLPTEDGTLLCLTSWIDLSGASWLLDSVLWAQPDLHVALPVTMTSILINGFHRELSRNPMEVPSNKTASGPSPPTLRELDNSPEKLDPLLDLGTVLVFHPRRPVETTDGTHDVLYTTGLRRISGSREKIRRKLSDFESYPNFIDQVQRVETQPITDGFRSEWFFKLGLGLLSIPISFTIDYDWETDDRLVFEMAEGHFDFIAGCLEWQELSEGETVYGITSGSYIGQDAPRLVQLANAIPYRELFMGATLSTVILQKSKHWLEN